MRGAWVACAALVACGALREGGIGDDDAPAPVPDASGDDDDDALPAPPDASPDAGRDAPPIREDVVCAASSAWYAPERTAECKDRVTQLVQPYPADAIEGNYDLDIAWSAAKRAAIVLSYRDDIEASYLQGLVFDTTPRTVVVRADRVDHEFPNENEGAGARVAARNDGAFDVLSLADYQLEGGDVSIRRFTADQGFLAPDLVFTDADHGAQLAILTHPDGTTTTTAMVGNGDDLRLLTKQRAAGAAAFTDVSPGNDLDFFAPGPRTNGNHRLAIDPIGGVHVAYESGLASTRSQPRYARLANGIGWDDNRTVDNNTPDAYVGAAISLFVVGDTKNVVYLRQAKDGDTPLPYAQLVRSRFRSIGDEIQRTVLVDRLPLDVIDGDHVDLQASAAAGVDDSGALHAVYALRIDQDGGTARCQVHYLREAAQDGAVVLLDDEVSPVVGCNQLVPPVAIAVEPGGRPHIAYHVVGQGVYYATRYDR